MDARKAGHQLTLLQGGAQYFAALEKAMGQAQEEIRLETYIFDFNGSGAQVAQALMQAATRGVRVHVLMDGAGTEHVPPEWAEKLSASGVKWHIYNPLGKLGLLIPSRWRRLHRKLCVVDGGQAGAVGFCGGINILDDYHDPNHGRLDQPRFDFAVSVRGPLVRDMHQAMLSLWFRLRLYRKLQTRQLQSALDSWQQSRQASAAPAPDSGAIPLGSSASAAKLLLRDNLRHRRGIERAYLKAIGEAKHEIIIANAYFLPGGKLRTALLEAAKRGVKVRLLLQGRYEYFMQYHAARPVYEVMLRAGVEVHEYAVSFLHAKVAVIDAQSDQAWATVGSSNLDPLSLLLAREANLAVRDKAFALQLRAQLISAIQNEGHSVALEALASRPWLQKMLDRVAYALMRLALSITGRHY